VAIYSTFLQRAFDQIVHDVCLQNLPVVFCIDRAGLVGEDGPTHHGVFDMAYLRPLPNLVIMSPKDENELQHMLYTALKHPGPVALRYPRGEGVGTPLDNRLLRLPIGRAETVREGPDAAILAAGYGVPISMAAAGLLSSEGISVSVLNARFVKPLDRSALVRLARRHKYLVTVEDHALQGGFGSAVLELLEEERIPGVEVRRVGIPDRFIDHGPARVLREQLGLTPEGIAREVRALLRPDLSSANLRLG
jgi:1-deoxy-D-xylulose-5-phosphate synthase